MQGCQVCGLPDDGYHFKALTCRACAAFFRRSIIKRAKYTCKFSNECSMNKELRKACAACRLEKCRIVGMDEKDVQWNRDANGPLKTPRTSSDGSRTPRQRLKSAQSVESITTNGASLQQDTPSSSGFSSIGSVSAATTSSCESPNSSISTNNPSLSATGVGQSASPLLNQILSYVQEYFRGEKALYTMLYPERNDAGDGIVFYPTCHTEMVAMERGCLSLIQQLIFQMNPATEHLTNDGKLLLLRSFFALFSPLRKCYLTSVVFPEHDDLRFAPHYGQYANDGQHFYKDDYNPKKSYELSSGVHSKARQTIAKLRNLCLREIEFAALCAIILANEMDLLFKKDVLSEYRDQVYRELHDDIFAIYSPFEGPNRFGSIICLLQDLMNISREVEETVVMCKLFSPHKAELNEIYSP